MVCKCEGRQELPPQLAAAIVAQLHCIYIYTIAATCTRFRFGSGWFRFGSGLVQVWFRFGATTINIYFVQLQTSKNDKKIQEPFALHKSKINIVKLN